MNPANALLPALRQPSLETLAQADWPALLRAATGHNLAPLLYHRLRAAGVQIPEAVRQPWQEAYLAVAADNIRRFYELGHALRVFHEAGIPVIALKGAHLAPLVYEKLALRPMCDVDLLVREGDLSRAEEQLRALGYRSDEINASNSADDFHLVYASAADRVIELHWAIEPLASPFRINVQDLWARAKSVTIADAPALVLAPADLLLHLCLHLFAHHSFNEAFASGLRALCDVAETIRRYREVLNWAEVGQRASEWGARNGVYLVLRLAHDLVGADVPDAVLADLAPADFQPRYLESAQALMLEGEDILGRNSVDFWLAEGTAAKAASFWRTLFPPRERMARAYSLPPDSRRVYWYYVLRLWDATRRYGRIAWELLHHRQAAAWSGQEAGAIALIKWLSSG